MTYTNELYHHGVKGMRWGVRRYQNEDGSLTAAGKRRYGDDIPTTGRGGKETRAVRIARDNHEGAKTALQLEQRAASRLYAKAEKAKAKGQYGKAERYTKRADRHVRDGENYVSKTKANLDRAINKASAPKPDRHLSPAAKRAIKIGAAVGVTALAAYGATKLVRSEQGQKLVGQLLNKHGKEKTTLDIGKQTSRDSRMIRSPHRERARDERFVRGYEKSDALWTLNPEGQQRLDRQERRNEKAMKNLGYSNRDAWNMHVTRSAGFNRKVDRRMDLASRGIHTKQQLGDYNTSRKVEAMMNARPWENEDATYFLRKNEETLRRNRK